METVKRRTKIEQMKFELTDEDMLKVREWQKEQNKKRGSDYYGAIGGELTYSFTPNNLGCVVIVEHGVTKEELDLTDYDW